VNGKQAKRLRKAAKVVAKTNKLSLENNYITVKGVVMLAECQREVYQYLKKKVED
jgi:hypothetical protein